MNTNITTERSTLRQPVIKEDSDVDSQGKFHLLNKDSVAVQSSHHSANLSECSRLREQVSRLFQENCSLKEHSAKLAIESKDLKKQVASVKADNTRLREKLQQFSSQLKCFIQNKETNTVTSQQVEQVKDMLDVVNSFSKLSSTEDDRTQWNVGDGRQPACCSDERRVPNAFEVDRDNLEQISNRLLEQLQQEKRELELQYTQMVEIQRSPLGCSIDGAPSFARHTALSYLDSCRNTSKLLKQEAELQNGLLAALIKQMSVSTTLESVPHHLLSEEEEFLGRVQTDYVSQTSSKRELKFEGESLSTKSVTRSSLEALLDVYGSHIPGWDGGGDVKEFPADDDRICPMCQAVFPKAIPLADFEVHVMEHFRSDDFEIIAHESGFG